MIHATPGEMKSFKVSADKMALMMERVHACACLRGIAPIKRVMENLPVRCISEPRGRGCSCILVKACEGFEMNVR